MELIIDQLSKHYGRQKAVNNFTFTMTNGVYGLLGANGAGKTTLIRMLCGVLQPTGGRINYDGIPVTEEAYRAELGYLPQDFGYYPDFTALDFLLYMACLKGLPKQFARTRARELLSLVSLEDVARKRVRTFSGGMIQRLGIAQALLGNPKILILDEPTSGLDPRERVRFRNLIAKLGNERIVLFSTHIVSDIETIAGKILIMKNGILIQSGSLQEILSALDNKVFECSVDLETAKRLSEYCTVISLREESDCACLHLVGNVPPSIHAVPVSPSLEDLYLYYFYEESARRNSKMPEYGI